MLWPESFAKDMILVAQKAREKQRYLELWGGCVRGNLESDQTAAQAVKEIAELLERTIAKHLVLMVIDETILTAPIRRAVKQENVRLAASL